MEFRDLKRQYQCMKAEIDAAIEKVCLQSNFIGGQDVKELEQMLAEYVGTKHCITCANGTDALELALMAMGVGNGDAVFVPDFTFFSSGEAPAILGAVPIFVDIDKDTYNMQPESLEKAILQIIQDGKYVPKVIITVDLFGQPADYDKISEIAEKFELLILEDGAQGFGGNINGKMACSYGDIGTTSFFPAKPLGCYGDGGAIFTDSDEYAELIRSYAVHGKGVDKYDNIRLGKNSRLDTIQAAILKIKLKNFIETELKAIDRTAKTYTQMLQDLVETPMVKEGYFSSWAQYSIKLPNAEVRERIQKALRQEGIPTMIYYKKPMHLQKAFENNGVDYNKFDYTNTEKMCENVLQLPIHPYMNREEVELVCSIIKREVEML